jgi:hypothetical protein
VTSRGVFLALSSALSSRSVVFISCEPFCGPLTLNLPGELEDLASLDTGTPVHLDPDRILFPTLDLSLHTRSAAVWEAPPPPPEILAPEEYQVRLVRVAQETLTGAESGSPAAALATFLHLAAPTQSTDLVWLSRLETIRHALASAQAGGRVGPVVEALDSLFGLGPGLTPSGDDLILGVLLTLSRPRSTRRSFPAPTAKRPPWPPT